MESQVKVHSLTAKCRSNPNWSEKMLFTHTHTHLFWSQSLHCSREAKTASMNSEWRGCMSWNDRNEERTQHLTGFSLSVESSRKRNTLDPSFYISAPLKTSRKWLNFSFVWGRQTYPLAARSQKVKLRSILWTFCNDCHGWRWKNNSPLFVLFVCFPPWPLNYSLKKKRKNNNNTQFRDNLSVRTVAQPSAWYCKSVSCRRGFCAPRLSLPPRVCVCSSVSVFRRQVCTVTKP